MISKIKNELNIGIYCSSLSYGGLEINLIRWAVWMKERGWNIKLLLVKDSPLYENALKNGLEVVLVNKNKRYFDYLNAYRLAQNLKKDDIKILFVAHTHDISIAAITKYYFYKKLKLIYQQQMQLGVDKRDFLHTFRFNQLDAWVAPLPWLAEQAKNRTKIQPDKVHTIPLGIELGKFENVKNRKNEALAYFGLSENYQYIGIIGRIDPHKGQKELIEAFKLIKKDNIKLLIVGEPTKNEGENYFNEIKNLIKQYSLENSVFIKPFTDKAELFFAAIDVFVMATKGETYGMVTLEAIAAKCVVVGNNTGGTKELIQPFCGELYENGNSTDLKDKIEYALANQASYYATEEYEKYIQQFSHTNECEMYEVLISKILSY